VYILIEKAGIYGWGETVFIPYYAETYASFRYLIDNIKLPPIEDITAVHTYIQDLKEKFVDHQFAIAGLDIALHNFICQKKPTSIASLYNVQGNAPKSAYTLGISTKDQMRTQIESNSQVPYFKLKVSQDEIERIIDDYVSLCNKPFVIDANQGFTDKKLALYWADTLAELQVDYLEQPFHKDDWSSHQWLKKRSTLPIIADESFQSIRDVVPLADYFDGINVKLMKSGGISEAANVLKRAKDIGLKTVLGCMSESSIAVNAAWELAPLANWADLDGPQLINNDPFNNSIAYDKELMVQILTQK